MDSIQVKVTPWSTTNALIYLPDDYSTTNKNYPMIICLHGKSKSGNDIKKLTLEGIPYWINNGEKIQAKNPVNGKLYKFIVVAPQAPSWGLKPAEINRVLDDIGARYRIDQSRIYITGYSAGGWSATMAITESRQISERFAAAVPMSPSSIDNKNLHQFKLVAEANIHCWYIAGTEEKHFLQECERYVDSTNKYSPGLAKLSIIPGFRHHSWKQLYDIRNKIDGMSIYEWMLQYQKSPRHTSTLSKSVNH
jgi:predicted peptidase